MTAKCITYSLFIFYRSGNYVDMRIPKLHTIYANNNTRLHSSDLRYSINLLEMEATYHSSLTCSPTLDGVYLGVIHVREMLSL